MENYLEGIPNSPLWGEFEDHSVKKPTTPEKLRIPEVNPVTSPLAGSGTKSATPRSDTTSASRKKVMAGGEMKLPVFYGNGSEDPQQHWFLCEAVWRVKQVTDANMKVA